MQYTEETCTQIDAYKLIAHDEGYVWYRQIVIIQTDGNTGPDRRPNNNETR